MSRYANSIGILELDIDGVKSDLKPTTDDVKEFREILFNKKYKNDTSALFSAIEEFVIKLIKRFYPCADTQEEDELKMHVALNTKAYFEELMVAFKFTTKEQIKEQEKEALSNLKNLIGND